MKIQSVNLSDIDTPKTDKALPSEVQNEFHKDFTSHNNLTVTAKAPKDPKVKAPLKQRIKEKLTKRNILIGSIVTGVIVIIVASLLIYNFIIKVTPAPSSIITLNSNYLLPAKQLNTESFITPVTLHLPSEPKTEPSPINGVLFTTTEMAQLKTRRPIFITVDNQAAARPQSNFSKADMVFETLAEAGISRYMAVYWNNTPNVIGPMRSLRQYFLEWLSPYDPILVHDGCATADNADERINACGNVVNYGTKRLNYGTYGAFRDNTRYAPHNEYVDPSVVWSGAKDQGWNSFPENLETLKYKKDAPISERGTKTKVQVKLNVYMNNYGAYDSTWTYDTNRNAYLRQVGGQKDIDRVTGEQIEPKVVVIQEVPYVNSFDSKGHVIITTIGEGKAKILQDGKIFDVTWKKLSKNSINKYYNADGTEFQFNRGQMWIVGVPNNDGQINIIEQ